MIQDAGLQILVQWSKDSDGAQVQVTLFQQAFLQPMRRCSSIFIGHSKSTIPNLQTQKKGCNWYWWSVILFILQVTFIKTLWFQNICFMLFLPPVLKFTGLGLTIANCYKWWEFTSRKWRDVRDKLMNNTQNMDWREKMWKKNTYLMLRDGYFQYPYVLFKHSSLFISAILSFLNITQFQIKYWMLCPYSKSQRVKFQSADPSLLP